MVFKIIYEYMVLRLIIINVCKNCFYNKFKGKKMLKKKLNIELIFLWNIDKLC